MYLTRLKATGLHHVPELDPLERCGALPSAPQATAIGDAVRLWAIALDPAGWEQLASLGWLGEAAAALGEDEVDMVLGLAPPEIDRAVDGPTRSISIDLTLAPDPPLYGRLREHAVRDPRLVTALGQQAELHVKAGFLFTADRTGATPDLLGARIGDVSFPIAGKERPRWLAPMLAELSRKLRVIDFREPMTAVVGRLHAAATSHRPEERMSWQRAAAALTAAPFDLPPANWMTTATGLQLAFGDTLVDLRHMGRPAADALRVVEAGLVSAPDVLVITEALAEPVATWLQALTEGDDATLEQVLIAGPRSS